MVRNRTFLEVDSMVVNWWIVTLLRSDIFYISKNVTPCILLALDENKIAYEKLPPSGNLC